MSEPTGPDPDRRWAEFRDIDGATYAVSIESASRLVFLHALVEMGSQPDDLFTLIAWPFGLLAHAVTQRFMDRSWRVVVYRRTGVRPRRPVHVEFCHSEDDAYTRGEAVTSNWLPGQFANARPVSLRRARRQAEKRGALATR